MEHFSIRKYESQIYVKKGKEDKYGINERIHIWKSLRICWGQYLDLRGRKSQHTGENYQMRSFAVCLLLAK